MVSEWSYVGFSDDKEYGNYHFSSLVNTVLGGELMAVWDDKLLEICLFHKFWCDLAASSMQVNL